MEGGLLEIGETVEGPAPRLSLPKAAVGVAHPGPAPAAGGKKPVGSLVPQTRKRDLAEVAQAASAAAGLAGTLHGRQQQAEQETDDRDHDEQLHERDAAAVRPERDGRYGAHASQRRKLHHQEPGGVGHAGLDSLAGQHEPGAIGREADAGDFDSRPQFVEGRERGCVGHKDSPANGTSASIARLMSGS